MENNSYDSKKLRKISAHLRQLHLNDYLKSRSFILFCEAYDVDDIWHEVIENHPEQQFRGLKGLTNNSYSDSDTDTLFKKFAIQTYFLKKERFAEIVPEFLSDYSKWSQKYYDLNEPTPVNDDLIKIIWEDLLEMGYVQTEIDMHFQHAGYDVFGIMYSFDKNVYPQRPSTLELPMTNEEKNLNNRKIFIVHGHNDQWKTDVENFLTELKLEPIILHKQANRGKTIIEKVEHYSDVGFAIILLTQDDIGCSLGGPEIFAAEEKGSVFTKKEQIIHAGRAWGKQKYRARQNVIFEFGFFISKLGRERVAALCEGDIEQPSDTNGLLYTLLDEQGEWKKKIAQEINATGIKIDEVLLLEIYLKDRGFRELNIDREMNKKYAQDKVYKNIQILNPEFLHEMMEKDFVDSNNSLTGQGKVFIRNTLDKYLKQ